jgi:hypothetical protein
MALAEELRRERPLRGELVVPLHALLVNERELELSDADDEIAGRHADPRVLEREAVEAPDELSVDAVSQVSTGLLEAQLDAAHDETMGDVVLAGGGVVAPVHHVPRLDAAEDARPTGLPLLLAAQLAIDHGFGPGRQREVVPRLRHRATGGSETGGDDSSTDLAHQTLRSHGTAPAGAGSRATDIDSAIERRSLYTCRRWPPG